MVLDIVLGALAGALGTSLMQPASKAVPQIPSPETVPRPQVQQDSATEKAAERLLAPLGIQLEGERKKKAGQVMHFLYGTTWGAIYGALAGQRRGRALASGVLFGFTLWLLGDELLVPALHFAGKAGEYPVDTHARALAAHLAYGATTDGAFRALRRGARIVRS